jgi:hypothetical protein
LLLINDIRNVFAHSLHAVDFSNELVEADCAKLNSHQPGGVLPEPQNAKERYLWNVLDLYHVLRSRVTVLDTEKALRDEKKA